MTSSEKTLEMNSDAFSYKRVLETESLVGSTEREKQIAVAVFVKTPGHSALKTRLAKSIGYPKAENFHIRSCKAIEALLLNLREKSPQFHPYWAVAEEEALGHSLWSNFPCLLQGQGDLGSRLSEIYSSLLQDFDYVLLMGADCPFMAKEDILQAVSLLENSSDFCLGEAEDGGYYLFGGKKEIPKELWLKVPYSQENTAKVFSEELLKLGSLNKDLPVLFDVDTVQDYEIAMKQAFI